MKKIIIYCFSNLFLKAKCVFFAGLIVSLLLYSCVKEGDFEFDKLASNTYDPTLAIPFISTRLSLKDILKDTSGIIQTNTDNSLKLVYDADDIHTIEAKELLIIPNQQLQTDNNNLNFPPIPIGDTLTLPSIPIVFPFDMPKPGQIIDSVYVKAAILKLNIKTDLNHSGNIVLTSPNIKLSNGQAFKVIIPLDYSSSIINVDREIDLSGCVIKFNNTPGHTNELLFNYVQSIYGDINANNAPYFLHFQTNLNDFTFNKFFGYIGFYELDIQESIVIQQDHIQDLFDVINFSKVGLSANFKNSFGMPVEIQIDTILAVTPTGNVLVTNFPNQNPFDLNYPSLSQIGQSLNTIIPYQENASLAVVINKSPTEIIFKLKVKLNPDNNASIPNFMLENSKIDIGLHLELPLVGRMNGFVLQDTLGFALAEKLENAEEVTFRINATNAFPLDVNVQVYFADSLYQIIDSIIPNSDNIILSGLVDATTHIVTVPTPKLTEVVISKERVRKIERMKASNLIIRGKLSSFNNGNQDVKITSKDYLDVKLSMKIKLNVNTK